MATLKAQQRHICRECNRGFTKAEHLRRHVRVHTKERPFRCDDCGMSYARIDTLQRHTRSHRSLSQRLDSDRESRPCGASETPPLPSPGAGGDINQNLEGWPHSDLPGFQGDDAGAPAGDDMWNLEHNEVNGFDLINAEYMDSYDWASLNLLLEPPAEQVRRFPEWDALANRAGALPIAHQESTPLATPVRWFSDIPHSAPSTRSGTVAAPETLSSAASDQAYRDVVQKQIEPVPNHNAVPSTQSLAHCVRLYLEKCQALLPIVHPSTFRASESNALLLYSIASVGTQLVGLPELAQRGERMFESFHRAILTSWMSILTGSHEGGPVIQAVVLAQTFAMMSPNPAHLLTAQVFHGTLVLCYARSQRDRGKCQVHQQHLPMNPSLEEQWQLWATNQSFVRIEHALKVLDAELCLLGHCQPQMRPGFTAISESEDRAFYARDAKTWERLKASEVNAERDSNTTSDGHRDGDMASQSPASAISGFSQYARLADILAHVCKQRFLASSAPDMTGVEHQLEVWLKQNSEALNSSQIVPFQLECLWHSGWLAILCDIDLLEIACGRDGDIKANETRSRVAAWASHVEAHRALVHAFKVQQLLLRISLSEAVALHVPRAAYHAGLVLICMAENASLDLFPIKYEWETMATHRDLESLLATHRFKANDRKSLEQDFTTARRLREQACILVSVLRRLWPWGIAQRFASTLTDLLQV